MKTGINQMILAYLQIWQPGFNTFGATLFMQLIHRSLCFARMEVQKIFQ